MNQQLNQHYQFSHSFVFSKHALTFHFWIGNITSLPRLTSSRSNLACIIQGNSLIVSGGDDGGDQLLTLVEKLDLK
jgi:hypothetical protein